MLFRSSKLALEPISDALLVFTDGSSTGTSAVSIKNRTVVIKKAKETPAQQTEIAVITALEHLPEEFNLYTDSKYVVHLFPDIETALISGNSKIISLLLQLQNIIQSRKRKKFIGHIRGHTGLPGPLDSGNAMTDLLMKEHVIASMVEQDRKSVV